MKTLSCVFLGLGCTVALLFGLSYQPKNAPQPEKKVVTAVTEEPRSPPPPPTREERERAVKAANELTASLRRELVEKQEHIALKNGIDAHITARGIGNKIYKFEYILLSRPLVYQMVNENNLVTKLRSHGFTKAILTDGNDRTWTFDLTKP
jgi:hypothetical protein